MKNSYLSLIAVFLIAIGCYPPPEYPDAPSISFNDVTFYDNPTGTDSLVLSLNFRDGNGDLGLRPTENNEPYNPINYPRDNDGNLIERGSDPSLPDDDCSYVNQLFVIEGDSVYKDIYIEPNENHFNIEVDFLVKKGGTYEPFNFQEFYPDDCGLSFYGRFPLLQDDDDIGTGPVEGVLNYRMKSPVWNVFFAPDDSIRIQARIRDRALNVSEQILTPPFTFQAITN